MTEISPQPIPTQTAPRQLPSTAPIRIQPPFTSQATRPSGEAIRNAHRSLDVFSPVNQNGSFEFDRVLKAGDVLKRTRKTKAWKQIHLVLRPNLLSIYKDKDETKLRHQINLSELTAVARQKDPKGKVQYVFGLFSPSRNYHLSASTEKEAQEWVELIRSQARIDEEEEEMILASPSGGKNTFKGFGRHKPENPWSSSSETEMGRRPPSSVTAQSMHSTRRPSHYLNYSGNEHCSYSDFSDTPGQAGFLGSSTSLPYQTGITSAPATENVAPGIARNSSQVGGLGPAPDDERVVCHGWLHLLKSKGGMRQWKKCWVVLRPKTLAFYKNEEEYAANLVLQFPNIINAVDIDPISKTKRHCMQIITEERNYRFCAPDEDSVAKWLGALKSLLAKRKEVELQRAAATHTDVVSPPQPLAAR